MSHYIYILHFTRKLYHAQHYIGYSRTPIGRVLAHRQGRSDVKIVAACHRRGIGFLIGQVIGVPSRKYERYLKKQKRAKDFCKICNPHKYQRVTERWLHKQKEKEQC